MPAPKSPLEAVAAPDRSPPPVIPGYELLRRIGQGSYGEVWLARAAGAYRAVKVVWRKTFEHERPYERELSGIRKFEPVSRSHPSQVSILQVGQNEAEGYFYYVMELADDAGGEVPSSKFQVPSSLPPLEVDGAKATLNFEPRTFNPSTYTPKTLKSEISKHGRLPFAACLDLSLALTTALDHLHRHGLIHRDIKPSNVIFVQGVPKLADIGLVTDAGATISHVGTEGFLPPEGPGTAQADIYSLGKVLYEMSTGRDRLEFPELPTVLGDSPEERGLLELNLVFLKACQNDPARRYPSAREMAADLALLQSGRSLKQAKALEQRLANVRRLAVATALVAVLAVVSYYVVEQRRVKKLRAEVSAQEKEKQIFKNAAQKTLQQLVNACAANADQLAAQRDFPGALLWLARALREDHDDPAHNEAHRRRIAETLPRCPKVSWLTAHGGPVNTAAFSPDGRRVLTASDDHTAQLWDAATGEPVGPALKLPAAVLHAAFSGDGQRVVTASADGTAQVWNTQTGAPAAAPLRHGNRILHAEFSPNGRQLLTVADDNAALVWEGASGKPRHKLTHQDRVLAAAFSPDGRRLATTGADRIAQIWNTDSGEARTLPHDGPVEHLAFSADGRRLVTASGAQARVWNTASSEPAHFILKHDGLIQALAFSPDGRWLATAGEDRTARVWDAITGRLVSPSIQHQAGVPQLAFSPDGRWLLTASANHVQLWNPSTGEAAAAPLLHNDRVTRIQFSGSGDRILTASADQTARILNVEDAPNPSAWAARSVDELTALAEFLSGRRIENDIRIAAVKPEVLRQLWQTLRAGNAGEFAARDLSTWHPQHADEAEKQRRWFATRFHWERALAVSPKNTAFAARRDFAAAELARANAPAPAHLARRIPPRPDTAKTNLIDLSAFYNAALTETWYPTNLITAGNDLSALPRGVQRFGGIEFDVRGLIQLSGGALENLGGQFPRQVADLPVKQKCRRLHFLHGAGWSAPFGTHVGSYHIRYANGETHEVRLVFGQNLRDWWFTPPAQTTTGAAIAWEGSNAASRELGMAVRVYQMTWVNPLPDVEVVSLDFRSTLEKPAPFLVAVSVEVIAER